MKLKREPDRAFSSISITHEEKKIYMVQSSRSLCYVSHSFITFLSVRIQAEGVIYLEKHSGTEVLVEMRKSGVGFHVPSHKVIF